MSYIIKDFINVLKLSKASLKGLIKRVSFPQTDEEEVIIMGNGPSLKDVISASSNLLKRKNLLAVNFSPFSESFFDLKPKYLVLADPGFWEQSSSAANHELVENLCNIIRDKIDWPFIIFLPTIAKNNNKFKQIVSINNHISFSYYNIYPLSTGSKYLRHFAYRKRIAMPIPQNVLIAAVFICIHMGYRKIKLIGAEHSWLNNVVIGDDNVLYIKDVHYYDTGKKTNLTPWYMNTEQTRVFKYHEILRTLSITFSSYWQLAEYAKSHQCTIENCTENSYIDAFDKTVLS